MVSGPSLDNGSHPWRHELDHDAESVFWLIYYWALCVQPEGYPKQDIPDDLWGGVTGSVGSRIRILGAIAGRFYPDHGTHSLYAPLWPLIEQLAAILLVDGYWLDNSEPRRNLGYITEAFQRLILDFVLKHHFHVMQSHEKPSRSREKNPEWYACLLRAAIARIMVRCEETLFVMPLIPPQDNVKRYG